MYNTKSNDRSTRVSSEAFLLKLNKSELFLLDSINDHLVIKEAIKDFDFFTKRYFSDIINNTNFSKLSIIDLIRVCRKSNLAYKWQDQYDSKQKNRIKDKYSLNILRKILYLYIDISAKIILDDK